MGELGAIASQKSLASATKLICFHHAGGNNSLYSQWKSDENLEVLSFQMPGRLSRFQEAPVANWKELKELIFTEIDLDWEKEPFALFGHSLGGLVAFHLALELEAADCFPRALFISAVEPQPKGYKGRPYHKLTDEELTERMREMGGTPPIVWEQPELLNLILPLLRSDYRLLDELSISKDFKSKIMAPIHVFSGDEDSVAPTHNLYQWEQLTEGGLDLKEFSGGHFYLERRRDEIGEEIRERLTY